MDNLIKAKIIGGTILHKGRYLTAHNSEIIEVTANELKKLSQYLEAIVIKPQNEIQEESKEIKINKKKGK